MEITKNLIIAREKKGLSQADVAKKLGTTRANYSNLEKRGEKLSLQQLQKFANAIGVGVLQLLGESHRTPEFEKVEAERNDYKKKLEDCTKTNLDNELSNTFVFQCLNRIFERSLTGVLLKERIGYFLVDGIKDDLRNMGDKKIQVNDLPTDTLNYEDLHYFVNKNSGVYILPVPMVDSHEVEDLIEIINKEIYVNKVDINIFCLREILNLQYLHKSIWSNIQMSYSKWKRYQWKGE